MTLCSGLPYGRIKDAAWDGGIAQAPRLHSAKSACTAREQVIDAL
jgi:hypothetical protein